jgi:signal transduction histidine kinase
MDPETTTREEPNPDGVPESSRILSEFRSKELSRHLALFYDSREMQLVVSAAFAKHELQRGRRFLYLYEDNDEADVRVALGMADIDVETRLADGDLKLEDAADVYLNGQFDPDSMIQSLDDATGAALDAGYNGLSVAGENTWCFHTSLSFDHIIDFESQFDAHAPELPITTLCQYSLDRFDQESIGKALWTHEQIVYRGRICENPFYVPPSEFRESEPSQSEARLMLEQARSLSQARRDLDIREQRIEVLNRTLRHNIRNETNIVLGHLEGVLESDRLSPEERRRIEIAREYVGKIARTSEKARYVEATLTDDELEPIDLGAVVSTSVEQLRRKYPAVDVTTSVADRPTLLADRNLREAVDELLENAVRHQDRSPPVVTVSLDRREGDRAVVLEVSNPGEPIPEDDKRALRTGEETPLQHGRGIGLWMVKWIAENSHGRLTFPPAETGSRVRIELPLEAVADLSPEST